MGRKSACARIAARYQHRRDTLCDGLAAAGWDIQKPKATMFVWAPIPEQYRDFFPREASKGSDSMSLNSTKPSNT